MSNILRKTSAQLLALLHYTDGGQAEGYFTIRQATENVFTGDRFPLIALSGVMVVSLITLGILLIWKKRK